MAYRIEFSRVLAKLNNGDVLVFTSLFEPRHHRRLAVADPAERLGEMRGAQALPDTPLSACHKSTT
jgi:hypothetical protein